MDAWQQEADAYISQQTDYRAARRGASAVSPPPSPSLRPVLPDRFAPSGLAGARRPASSVGTLAPSGMLSRKGLLGWWLRLTAPSWPRHLPPIGERERLRKAELTSLSILAVALLLAALFSTNLARPETASSALLAGAGLLAAAALNRGGWTRTAAYLVPSILMLVIVSAIVWADGGLQLATVPAYDLFVLPIFLTSLIGDRRAPWAFATLAIAFILCDVILQPYTLNAAGGAPSVADMQNALNIEGWWGQVNGPLALALFAAFIGWLGTLSVEGAITRADRAVEIATLELQAAEHKRQLEAGVRQILATHVRVANGDFTARAPLGKDNILWQIGSSLNNLIARMQRTAQAEQALRRTEAELRRLAGALDEAEGGQRPTWPAPSGTAADLVLVRIAHNYAQGSTPTPQTPTRMPASGDGVVGRMEGMEGMGGIMGLPSLGSTPWSAASLIDPDAFSLGTLDQLGQTAVLPETRLAQQTLAGAPSLWATAHTTSAPLSMPSPLPLSARAPSGTAPGAANTRITGAPRPSQPLDALNASSASLSSKLDSYADSWPAWLAESDARLRAGTPRPEEAAALLGYVAPSQSATPAAPSPGSTASDPAAPAGDVPLLPVLSPPPVASPPVASPPVASPPVASPPEALTTEAPSNALAQAWSQVPWRSETRRRRSLFLGPAPNPPWMDPNAQ
jgi:hypothetical protein